MSSLRFQRSSVVPALRRKHLAVSAVLAAASAACAFAAVAVSAYAGHPAQHAATLIYALFGACSGTGCVVMQRVLASKPPAPLSREEMQRPPGVALGHAAAPSPGRQVPMRASTRSASTPAADVALTA